MKKVEVFGRVLLASLVVAVVIVGMTTLVNDVQAKKPGGGGRCICPMVYAPVLCDNGKTYSNQCVADCRGGKNCVPVGPGPIPL